MSLKGARVTKVFSGLGKTGSAFVLSVLGGFVLWTFEPPVVALGLAFVLAAMLVPMAMLAEAPHWWGAPSRVAVRLGILVALHVANWLVFDLGAVLGVAMTAFMLVIGFVSWLRTPRS